MVNYINKVKSLATQLTCLKVLVKDKDVVMTLLDILPPSFDHLIIALESRPMKELTLEKMCWKQTNKAAILDGWKYLHHGDLVICAFWCMHSNENHVHWRCKVFVFSFIDDFLCKTWMYVQKAKNEVLIRSTKWKTLVDRKSEHVVNVFKTNLLQKHFMIFFANTALYGKPRHLTRCNKMRSRNVPIGPSWIWHGPWFMSNTLAMNFAWRWCATHKQLKNNTNTIK